MTPTLSMRSVRIALVAGAVALQTLATAPVQAVPAQAASVHGGAGGTLTLRYRFLLGQQLTYRLAYQETVTALASPAAATRFHIDLPPTPQTQQATELIREHVTAVDPNGVGTIAYTVGRAVLTTTAPPTLHFTAQVAPDGRAQGRVTVVQPTQPVSAAAQLGVLLPLGPLPMTSVALGAHWVTPSHSQSTSTATGSSTTSATVTSTLLAVAPLNGKIVATLVSVGHEEISTTTPSAANGRLWEHYSSDATERDTFDLTAGQRAASTSTITSTLSVATQTATAAPPSHLTPLLRSITQISLLRL